MLPLRAVNVLLLSSAVLPGCFGDLLPAAVPKPIIGTWTAQIEGATFEFTVNDVICTDPFVCLEGTPLSLGFDSEWSWQDLTGNLSGDWIGTTKRLSFVAGLGACAFLQDSDAPSFAGTLTGTELRGTMTGGKIYRADVDQGTCTDELLLEMDTQSVTFTRVG